MSDTPVTSATKPVHRPDSGLSPRAWPSLFALVLALGTLTLYLPARNYAFVAYDDPLYFSENAPVQAGLGWQAVKWAFTTNHAGNWHPVTWLSHMLDAQLFGTGPVAPHVVNAILHAANAALLLLLLYRCTGALWRSAIVAALFALHPLRVESVAWVSERKDVLSAFFFLLTLWAYVRAARGGTSVRAARGVASESGEGRGESTPRAGDIHRQRSEESTTSPVDERVTGGALPSPLDACPRPSALGAVRWYLIALLFFALGLMSKPMLVTLPFVLLLLDWWPLGRWAADGLRGAPTTGVSATTGASATGMRRLWPLLLEKLPFFVLSAASCVVTFAVQQRAGAVSSLTCLPVGERIANALVSYAQYVGKTFWPVNLAVFYPFPGRWSAVSVMLAAAIVVGLLFASLRLSRRLPFFTVGWLWFLGMLVPTVGFVQIGSHALADRYTYLPAIGLLVGLVWTAAEACWRWQVPRVAVGTVAAVLVVALAVRTSGQLEHWRNTETLFGHAIAVTERNGLAHDKLGNALLERGQVDRALENHRRAVKYQPGYPEFHNNLGRALARKGQVAEAIAEFRAALEIDPALAIAHENIGALLLQRGQAAEALPYFARAVEIDPNRPTAQSAFGTALMEQGRFDEALVHLDEALRLAPGDSNARNRRGSVLLQLQRSDEAVAEFQRVVRAQPDFPEAHANLALGLLQQGRVDDGVAELQTALTLRPDFMEAHYRLGNVFLQNGRFDEAITHLQKAIALRGDSIEAHNDLGVAFMQKGLVDDAFRHFQKAVDIGPRFAEGHSNLAKVLQEKGDVRAAVTHYRVALKLEPDNPDTLGSLAWLLATSPDRTLRSGTEAAMFAQRANQRTGYENPLLLRTLAAAYAEVGRFAEAVSSAQRAMAFAARYSDAALVEALRADLETYRAGSPLRDAGRTEPHQ